MVRVSEDKFMVYIFLFFGFIIGRCGGWIDRLDKVSSFEVVFGGSWGGVVLGCGSGIVGGWVCRFCRFFWWSCCCCLKGIK